MGHGLGLQEVKAQSMPLLESIEEDPRLVPDPLGYPCETVRVSAVGRAGAWSTRGWCVWWHFFRITAEALNRPATAWLKEPGFG